MTYSTIGPVMAAPCFAVTALPIFDADAFVMETSPELLQPEFVCADRENQWIAYEASTQPNRLGGLRFAVAHDGSVRGEAAGRGLPRSVGAEPASGIGVAAALVAGATGCAGVPGEKAGEVDPFPTLSGLLVSIVTFMLGIWIGRSMRSPDIRSSDADSSGDPQGDDSANADSPGDPQGGDSSNADTASLPKVRDELDTLPDIPSLCEDGKSNVDGAGRFTFAPFSSIDTSGLSKVEAEFLDSWASFASIFHMGDVGSAIKPKLGYIIRNAVSGFYSKLSWEDGYPTDSFFDVMKQMARGYAAMEPEAFVEIAEHHALFSVLLEDPAIIADPRIEGTLVVLAGMKSTPPIEAHAFVESRHGRIHLKDSVRETVGFGEAVARFAQNRRLWGGEFGAAFMSNLAEILAHMSELAPAQARAMRFALLINSHSLSEEARETMKRFIMDAFDIDADREWLVQIASKQWPIPGQDDSAEKVADMARAIFDHANFVRRFRMRSR